MKGICPLYALGIPVSRLSSYVMGKPWQLRWCCILSLVQYMNVVNDISIVDWSSNTIILSLGFEDFSRILHIVEIRSLLEM